MQTSRVEQRDGSPEEKNERADLMNAEDRILQGLIRSLEVKHSQAR